MTIAIRKAVASDQPGIVALVRSERLKPIGLDCRNFCVAVDGERVVGAVQIRPHGGKAQELASFVVAPAYRGHKVGRRLLDHLLRDERRDVHAITVTGLAAYFSEWSFERETLCEAPRIVAFNALLGQTAGVLTATFRGRQLRRVCVLRRPGLSGAVAQPDGGSARRRRTPAASGA